MRERNLILHEDPERVDLAVSATGFHAVILRLFPRVAEGVGSQVHENVEQWHVGWWLEFGTEAWCRRSRGSSGQLHHLMAAHAQTPTAKDQPTHAQAIEQVRRHAMSGPLKQR